MTSVYVAPIVDPPAPPAEASGLKGNTRVEEPTRVQRTIARRSAESRATIPALELVAEVDMSACLALRDARGHSLTAMLVSACAQGLSQVPRANAAYRDGRFELYSRVNVGLVVHRADAYSTPTILDADTKSLKELSDECEALIDRGRAGFSRVASEYERGRPDYPAASVDWIVEQTGLGPGTVLVDLAAGTGKLTRL